MMPHSLISRPDRSPLVAPGEIEHLVEDMTVIASADVSLAMLQTRLAATGQWLPIDGDAAMTLGQLIEVNSTGPMRLGYGGWRDLLLGVQFRNHRGELITAGGKTVKNVAGYDLTKLMVGQAGTLGQLTTVVTRTYRKPTAALRAEWALDAPLVERVNSLLAGPLRPTWMLIAGHTLRCGYLADEASIAFYARELPRLQPAGVEGHGVEADIAERAAFWRWPGDQPAVRLSVPPARVLEVMQGNPAAAADPVHGIVLMPAPDRHTVEAFGFQGVFWDGTNAAPLNLRPVEAAVMEKAKAAFA